MEKTAQKIQHTDRIHVKTVCCAKEETRYKRRNDSPNDSICNYSYSVIL